MRTSATSVPAPKPIEGHLADLGLPPDRLNDQERREIALAIYAARIYGTSFLTFTSLDGFHCGDPLKYAISQIS